MAAPIIYSVLPKPFQQSVFDVVLKEQTLYLKFFSTSFRLYILSILHCLRLCAFNYIFFFLKFYACFSLTHQFYAINVNIFMVLNSNQVYVLSCAHITTVVQECGENEAVSILSFATE